MHEMVLKESFNFPKQSCSSTGTMLKEVDGPQTSGRYISICQVLDLCLHLPFPSQRFFAGLGTGVIPSYDKDNYRIIMIRIILSRLKVKTQAQDQRS